MRLFLEEILAEYEVSLQSAAAVLAHIDTERFEVLPFGITRNGDWYRYGGEIKRIAEDIWTRTGRIYTGS